MNCILSYIRQSLDSIYPPTEVKALSMMICCDILGLNAVDIYMGKDINLSDSEQRELENILSRLKKNEPIQYIYGQAIFCDRSFRVAPGVLIPRPETSELVECVRHHSPSSARILDIGTGSGCIAITLDLLLPEARVDAWDISEEALVIAQYNNELLGAKVNFRRQDILDEKIEAGSMYDVIVSNPPYIIESEKQTMDAHVLDWEPEQALFVPDHDPLLFYRRIAQLGRDLLLPGGRLFFEINQAYGSQMVDLLNEYHYNEIQLLKDFYQNDRMVMAKK